MKHQVPVMGEHVKSTLDDNRWLSLPAKLWSRARNHPFLLFLPFLLLYVVLVILKNNDAFESDEARYYMFSQNLLKGYYSDPAPAFNLWNGPGYPIFLMPFVALKLPMITIGLVNALFQYLAIVFLFKSSVRLDAAKVGFCLCVFMGFYYPAWVELPQIMTETITTFLVSAIGLLIVKGYQEQKRWHFIAAGLLFGYLVLVKIIFSNVLLALLAGAFLLWLFNRKNSAYRRLLIIPVVAFLINIPYLVYTWNLTGKKLYWGNSGGMSLYWMSTPYAGEYGEWHNSTISLYDRNETADSTIMFNEKKLQDNHRADYAEIYALPPKEQDDAFKKKAIDNIKSHPVKFARNMIANAGRLIFDYPYSYTYQTDTSLLRISINGILLTMILISAVVTAFNWRKIPFSLRVILMIMLLYLGGSLLVSVYQRMFYVILPWLFLWIGYVLTRSVKINLTLPKKEL